MRLLKYAIITVAFILSLNLHAYRIVALGDLHGDYLRTILILQKANLIDGDMKWVGGKSILVQVGDQIDRGAGDKAIIDLFEKISKEARVSGGRVYPLLGNHELMNVELDFRYVFDGAWEGFNNLGFSTRDNFVEDLPAIQHGRAQAFRPGGVYAKILAKRKVILKLGPYIFVHGGVTPNYAEMGIERLNREVSNWMKGQTLRPKWVGNSDGPFWSRHYSDDPKSQDCNLLNQTHKILKTKVMIVAHTVQEKGINSACDGEVIRIDTGISSYYNGYLEALEITDLGFKIID